MRTLIVAMALVAFVVGQASAQILPDSEADVTIARPSFPPNAGPLVAVDSAHSNYHTIDKLYGPFAALLRNDGFRVTDSKSVFTTESLAGIGLLVISNPLPAMRTYDESLNAPPLSAFTPGEIDAVKTWVFNGGSLLLVADHRPFAGSAALALAFGFRFDNGVASRPAAGSRDSFSIPDGTLKDDVITRGRSGDESVSTLTTFIGSAFHGPSEARPIIVLPEGYLIHECGLPCPEAVPKHEAKGLLQGAVRFTGC